MAEANAYILGTYNEELNRLGLQHQVWANEAQTSWETARFGAGNVILDLGCGPGFCSKELANLVGKTGNVLALDKSKVYLDYVDKLAELHDLNIETHRADFEDIKLPNNSLDGIYSRWALAWCDNPASILRKTYNALKPGGKMVFHEYFNWSTHMAVPSKPHLQKAIDAALQSFNDLDSEIDIGRRIPGLLADLGMKITHTQLLPKISHPNTEVWKWPKSFYQTYFPRIVELGYLSEQEVSDAFSDLEALEQLPHAILCCPMMIEVIAEKPY